MCARIVCVLITCLHVCMSVCVKGKQADTYTYKSCDPEDEIGRQQQQLERKREEMRGKEGEGALTALLQPLFLIGANCIPCAVVTRHQECGVVSLLLSRHSLDHQRILLCTVQTHPRPVGTQTPRNTEPQEHRTPETQNPRNKEPQNPRNTVPQTH